MTTAALLALFDDGTTFPVLAVSDGVGWILPKDPGPLADPGSLAGFRGYTANAPRSGTAASAALAALAEHGPSTNARLAELAGVAPPTMYRALESLRKRSAVIKHGTQYRLPAAPRAEEERPAEEELSAAAVRDWVLDHPWQQSPGQIARNLGSDRARVGDLLVELREAGVLRSQGDYWGPAES